MRGGGQGLRRGDPVDALREDIPPKDDDLLLRGGDMRKKGIDKGMWRPLFYTHSTQIFFDLM